jgi:hypothetical protein
MCSRFICSALNILFVFSAAGSVATPMVWSGSMASCAAGSASAATPRTLASSRYNHLIMLPSCAVIHQVSRLPVYCRELCIICCSGDLWIKSILILRPLHVYTHHIVFIRHMLLSILLWKHQLALVSEFIVQKLLSAASLTCLSFPCSTVENFGFDAVTEILTCVRRMDASLKA